VKKFTRRITTWVIRTISYAGRMALINSVLMGVFNFWAIIFIIPKGVIKELEIYAGITFGGLMTFTKESRMYPGKILARLRQMEGWGLGIWKHGTKHV